MKKLSRIISSIVVLLILAVVLIVLLIDPIAKSGVEKGAAYALGVETTVDTLDIRLLDGQLLMDGLNISNPQGFSSPHLAHSGKFDIQVKTGSLLSDTVQISEFQLDGLDLNIEQKLSGSNISKVIDNIKRLSKDKEPSKGPSKKVVVEHLLHELPHGRLGAVAPGDLLVQVDGNPFSLFQVYIHLCSKLNVTEPLCVLGNRARYPVPLASSNPT